MRRLCLRHPTQHPPPLRTEAMGKANASSEPSVEQLWALYYELGNSGDTFLIYDGVEYDAIELLSTIIETQSDGVMSGNANIGHAYCKLGIHLNFGETCYETELTIGDRTFTVDKAVAFREAYLHDSGNPETLFWIGKLAGRHGEFTINESVSISRDNAIAMLGGIADEQIEKAKGYKQELEQM